MLPGCGSLAIPCWSGIPREPVGIFTPTESHLRPSRRPHFCPTRDVAVGSADPATIRRAFPRSGSGRIVLSPRAQCGFAVGGGGSQAAERADLYAPTGSPTR